MIKIVFILWPAGSTTAHDACPPHRLRFQAGSNGFTLMVGSIASPSLRQTRALWIARLSRISDFHLHRGSGKQTRTLPSGYPAGQREDGLRLLSPESPGLSY